MRWLHLLLLLVVGVGCLRGPVVFAQTDEEGCGVNDSVPTGCRKFERIGLAQRNSATLFQFTSAVQPNEEMADGFFDQVQSYVEDFGYIPHSGAPRFGEERAAFKSQDRIETSEGVVMIVFRVGTRIGMWSVSGREIDHVAELQQVYDSLDIDEISSRETYGQVVSLLPTVRDLPSGFRLDEEDFSNGLDEPDSNPSVTTPDSANSREELEATIAALETQVSRSKDGDIDRPLSTQATNTDSLVLLDISTKDAGLGDGSLYAYVEVLNQSGRLYSYVGLDGTCRNAIGGIVGTGYGNTANVASGETVVITMIFLRVPTCTDVSVRFDTLTGLQ